MKFLEDFLLGYDDNLQGNLDRLRVFWRKIIFPTSLRLWQNWPKLLAKHHYLSPKSVMLSLSLTNDTETNKKVWQAIFSIFSKVSEIYQLI